MGVKSCNCCFQTKSEINMPKKVAQDLQKPQYAGFTVNKVAKSDSNIEVDLTGIPSDRFELVRQSKKAE